MGVILNLTTQIKFSLTLINSDVQFILCKVYNRVNSSDITSQTWTHICLIVITYAIHNAIKLGGILFSILYLGQRVHQRV